MFKAKEIALHLEADLSCVSIPQESFALFSIMSLKVEKEEQGPAAEQHDDPKANLHTLQDAQLAAAEEHSVGLKQALRENWKAAMWSAIISLTIVMEGYDLRCVRGTLFPYKY